MWRTAWAIALMVLSLVVNNPINADIVYFSNSDTHTIWKIVDGTSTVFADTGASTSPAGIATDNFGNVYVALQKADTILKFAPDGSGSVFANTRDGPTGISIDSFGNVYVTIISDNLIQKFTPTGVGSTFASAKAGLSNPFGLAIDNADNLYAGNFGNNRILKFSPDGNSSLFTITGNGGLAVDQYLNVYVSNLGAAQILKYSPDGVGAVIASKIQAGGITINSDGNLLVAHGDKLKEYSTDGLFLRTIATIPGAAIPSFIAVRAPEPTSLLLVGLTTACAGWGCFRRRTLNRSLVAHCGEN